ncbi:MAG: ABC transporter ATP-binding protein [Burkholderiaceae bacterium]
MLELVELSCGYGQMSAVRNLSLTVAPRETVALIGANGAGKTSTLMAVAGHLMLQSGRILLRGEPIELMSPQQRVANGVAWVPEGRRLFADLSVRENLIVGGYSRPANAQANNIDRVVHLFPRVGERLGQAAGSLSGGEQQMVAIGRALMAQPSLLLVDELSLGLMPKAVGQFYAALDILKTEGLAILLVEQNTSHALKAADHIVVLESGDCVWQGTAEQAAGDSSVIDAYLGLKA